nr:MAG TPA: hypothetical protein [Caudoviricetes sp.]
MLSSVCSLFTSSSRVTKRSGHQGTVNPIRRTK